MLVLWIKTLIQNRTLLKRFVERMPNEARIVLPTAYRSGRDPQKVFFFFTSKAQEILGADPELAAMRRTFVRMMIGSLVFPFLLFGFVSVMALAFAR